MEMTGGECGRKYGGGVIGVRLKGVKDGGGIYIGGVDINGRVNKCGHGCNGVVLGEDISIRVSSRSELR